MGIMARFGSGELKTGKVKIGSLALYSEVGGKIIKKLPKGTDIFYVDEHVICDDPYYDWISVLTDCAGGYVRKRFITFE